MLSRARSFRDVQGRVLSFAVNENGAGEATTFCERHPEPQIAEIADRFRELAGP